ncbi:MAG: hypothetical protein HPY58_00105 [Firmicutes bacterium]|nr:hypothetical protein [Bacillota bacterium]
MKIPASGQKENHEGISLLSVGATFVAALCSPIFRRTAKALSSKKPSHPCLRAGLTSRAILLFVISAQDQKFLPAL